MGTSPEWVTLWFGLCRLGAVAVPINTAYRGDFLANQLADSQTKMVALDRSLADRVFSIAGDVPTLRTVLVREDGKVDAAAADARGPPSASAGRIRSSCSSRAASSLVDGAPDLARVPAGGHLLHVGDHRTLQGRPGHAALPAARPRRAWWTSGSSNRVRSCTAPFRSST